MTNDSTTKETALDAFTASTQNIVKMLEELQAKANDHFDTDPDRVNWADAGTAKHIETQLREISDQVFKRGEYAE